MSIAISKKIDKVSEKMDRIADRIDQSTENVCSKIDNLRLNLGLYCIIIENYKVLKTKIIIIYNNNPIKLERSYFLELDP